MDKNQKIIVLNRFKLCYTIITVKDGQRKEHNLVVKSFIFLQNCYPKGLHSAVD